MLNFLGIVFYVCAALAAAFAADQLLSAKSSTGWWAVFVALGFVFQGAVCHALHDIRKALGPGGQCLRPTSMMRAAPWIAPRSGLMPTKAPAGARTL